MEPDLGLTVYRRRNPSNEFPREQSHLESAENAIDCTPKVWSARTDKGTSVGESGTVEKIRTRGLYPVCIHQRREFILWPMLFTSPTARSFPPRLNDIQVASLFQAPALPEPGLADISSDP